MLGVWGVDVEGGPESFAGFAVSVTPRLRRSALLLSGEPQLAEDLVQAVLVKLMVRWDRLGAVDAPVAYAQRVLYTTFCAWSGRRRSGEIPTGSVPEVAGPDDFEASTPGAVHVALMALPRRQRAVLVARFYEDLSVEQAAALLGLSVSNVKSLTARGLDRLRTVLASERSTVEGL